VTLFVLPLLPLCGQAVAITWRTPAQGFQPRHDFAHARTGVVAEQRFDQL
jgi:hypothetical protein